MKTKLAPLFMAALAFLCALLCSLPAQAQTLQFRYNFEDGPGTTTTNDPSSALYPLVMTLTTGSGTAGDLHGAANSGVQNTGRSLDLSTNPIAGNLGGSFVQLTNSTALGALGSVTDFTASIWIKMPVLQTNTLNQGSRIYNLVGSGLTDIGGVNSIGFQPQFASGAPVFPPFTMRAVIGNTVLTPPIWYTWPTNEWIFVAMTYNSTTGDACMYYGTEASPAKMFVVKNIGAGTNFNFTGTPSFTLGDRPSKGRSFPGWIDDARFYTGAGNLAFIENIRKAATPLLISNLSPDGSLLQAGTNTLSFTATSANGVNTSGVKAWVNGADISSSLNFTATTGGQIVTYNNLPINPTLITQANINGVAVTIQVTDAGGIVTSNSYVYDAFGATNFTWETEDYDFGGGLFIDNPVMTFVGPGANTYYQEQTAYVNITDANDDGATGGPLRVYRDPFELVETEFVGGGPLNTAAGGQANLGDLFRQKVLDAYNVTNIARDVNVGFFDGGTGSGHPNWMNYTRTYPAGNFNVFLRVANGGGNLGDSLDLVTDGWGTSSQTTTNLGTFSYPNSGSWDNFEWVPLRDAGGNLARVQLNGSTNTIRLTAGANGGGNVNFLLLTPANTNLPSISGVYPNGTNIFQPFPTFSFVASSPSGVNINTNSITVRLTVTNLLGQGFATNVTATSGLTFSGPATNRTVSLALISNEVYTASISVTDANGSPAATTVAFDTLSPVYTWEAEDYDFGGGSFIDNPAPDAYAGMAGIEGVDAHNIVDSGETFIYRSGTTADQGNTDAQRLQYTTNALVDYNLGWYDGGEWNNYTRTFPAGEYNVYLRGANGSTGSGVATLAQVTGGIGTATQTTTNIGTFTQNPTGDWQAYNWTPLRDAGGNLVKFIGGSVMTLRVTSGGALNPNFYAFFPANTNLPTLNNVFPVTGTQMTNTFSFNVLSAAGVSTNNIVVSVNGTNISPVITGNQNNWTVSYAHILPNSTYSITVTVTDLNGNSSSSTATFDTVNPNNYVWEVEDYDYNSGLFFDNPQTNAYNGLASVDAVDAFHTNPGGTYTYRPTGIAGGAAGDVPRAKYTDPTNPQVDGSLGFFSNGSWANYTRNYPAGTYFVYGRFATASAGTDALLGEVTSGWGTMTQSSNVLGSFAIPNTQGWTTYVYVPMRDASGNLATITLNGSTNTLQVIRPTEDPTTPDVNVNFMMLVPVMTEGVSLSGTNVVVSFPTLSGWNYQVQYKTNLADPNWNVVGTVPGNNGTQSLPDPATGKSRFYRVQVQ
ncbi:MAG TPA: Ig-like domain-containing protein [Verrucomicrobiae bacterium]|nr:Ig-like domain-containing protein [Verrucomicrobiae bacterium]